MFTLSFEGPSPRDPATCPTSCALSTGRAFLIGAELNREQRIPIALDLPAMTQLAQNLVGLPEEEALRALRKSVLTLGKADAGLLDAVLEMKRTANFIY